MGPIAASMRSAGWEEAVRYYASLPAAARGGDVVSSSAAARGGEIATRGIPRRDVPPCAECHGPSSVPKSDAYPILAGQHADYLAGQLRLLQNRQRGGSEYVHLMHSFVDRLTSDQIQDVAAYYASIVSPRETRSW
jgi:cytochrome c553